MTKKNRTSNTIVGHASSAGHEKDSARSFASELYDRDYAFKRGIRPTSPDRDPWSYKVTKGRAELNDHFYGVRDRREINMMMGTPHGFAHSRTAQEGHSVYKKFPSSKKGHRIGKR